MMREIQLNPGKSLSGAAVSSGFAFDKLEIPITIKDITQYATAQERSTFMEFQVNQMLMNSAVSLNFSYCYGRTQLIASLQGPSEAKGFKSDHAKAVIELTVKDTTTKSGSPSGAYSLESLRSELRSVLEQVISMGSYPKTVFTLQLFLVKNESDAQLFPACMNALLAVLNQGGIQLKVAPVAAVSVAVKALDMVDEGDLEIEVIEEPTLIDAGYTLINLVVHQHKNILYMKTSNEAFDFTQGLLGNEKSLKLFEDIIEQRSKDVCAILASPL